MKYIKIIVTPILFLAIFSCKKVIEIQETNLIAGDVALKTVANNEQEIIGGYAGLGAGTLPGIEQRILFNATVSDEVKKGEFYNAATVHEWQYSSTDVVIRDNFTAINLYYKVIDRVNRVLIALPKADSTRPQDPGLRSTLRGEALFLRAYCHFEVFRYYCGNYDANALALPYMVAPSLSPQARITMGPYFQQLVADMAEAKTLMTGLTDIYRATPMAVTGLQARVALYMGDWANAITYANTFIAALPLSPRASFTGIWTDANTNELAFKLKRAGSVGRLGSLFRGTSATTTQLGTVSWLVSDKLWNSYDQVNDIRFSAYLKDEPLLSGAGRPSHIVAKYAGGAYGSSTENLADDKIFRTGEMYLIRAEAEAQTNALPAATNDINALRTARITAYVNIGTYASKDVAIADIIQERFKELAYEGHRFWDLRRNNMSVVRLASDAPTTSAVTLATGNFRFVLPIPNSEIQANPLMVQNAGYAN